MQTKYSFLSVLLFLWVGISVAAADFSESFSQGLPSSQSGSETTVDLSSGRWTILNVYGYKSNNDVSARLNAAGAYLITPSLSRPATLSFKHKASGNYKDLYVEKSTDQGKTWVEVQRYKSGSGSFATASAQIAEDNCDAVLIRFRAAAATIYIDDVTITFSTMASEPTQQASLSLLSATGNSLKVQLAKGDGQGRLLVYQAQSAVQWQPTDGMAYTGSFPKRIEGELWAASSLDEDSVLIPSLEAGTTYHLAVFEYNGEAADRNYLLPAATAEFSTLKVPAITLHKTLLDFRNTKVGKGKTLSFSLSAKFLEPENDTLKLCSSSDEYSFQTPDGRWVDTLSIPYSAATLNDTIVQLRFLPTCHREYLDTLYVFGGAADTVTATLKANAGDTENYTYYLAPDGNDQTGDGSFEAPWYNLQKAIDAALPGEEIVCRGGEYFPSMMKDGKKTTVRITGSGTAEQRITIRNYEGELPVFNFKEQQPKLEGSRGILLTGNYWHLYGLHITRAGDNAIKLEGSHNIIERCTFSYNFDTGLQLGFGHDFSASGHGSHNDGSWCAYNDIIDCDSYRNCDYDTNYGSDADGFACKMHNGKGNRFIRCRAWENSDDAWDLYETDYPVVLIECWAWRSGMADDHLWVKDVVPVSHGFSGNGNAIKMGGNGTGGSSKGKHEAWHCVAFNCNKTGSVKGFDQNSHGGGEKLVNCLAFGNGYDFMFERASANSEYYNNVCLGKQEIAGGTESHNAIAVPPSKNAWTNQLVTGISAADYVSLSEEDAKAPRAADGSLPKRFARLKSGSRLVDKGLYLEMPFVDEFPFLFQPVYGLSRDIGPYELEEGEITISPQLTLHHKLDEIFEMTQTGNEGVVHFTTSVAGLFEIDLFDLNGRLVTRLFQLSCAAGAEYHLPFSLNQLQSGSYLCRLRGGNRQQVAKLVVTL